MTTTLRMFYARALFVFVFIFLALLTAFAGVAFAQEAGATSATAEPHTPDMIDLLFSTTSAAVYWLVALVWAALRPPAWIKDFFATKDAFHWDGIVDTGLDRAEAIVRRWGYDATKDKSGWINAMVTAVNTFNPEIADYFDKNKNGVIDFMEGYIPPREPQKSKVSPGLVALIATRLPEGAAPPPPSEAPQVFLKSVPGAPKPRVSNAVLDRLSKRATKQ